MQQDPNNSRLGETYVVDDFNALNGLSSYVMIDIDPDLDSQLAGNPDKSNRRATFETLAHESTHAYFFETCCKGDCEREICHWILNGCGTDSHGPPWNHIAAVLERNLEELFGLNFHLGIDYCVERHKLLHGQSPTNIGAA